VQAKLNVFEHNFVDARHFFISNFTVQRVQLRSIGLEDKLFEELGFLCSECNWLFWLAQLINFEFASTYSGLFG